MARWKQVFTPVYPLFCTSVYFSQNKDHITVWERCCASWEHWEWESKRERERVRKGRRSREWVRAIQKELRGENILVELMNRQTGEKSNSATNWERPSPWLNQDGKAKKRYICKSIIIKQNYWLQKRFCVKKHLGESVCWGEEWQAVALRGCVTQLRPHREKEEEGQTLRPMVGLAS